MTLIGPSPASKHLPRAPALRAGIHAVFLLQRPPEEAIEPRAERRASERLRSLPKPPTSSRTTEPNTSRAFSAPPAGSEGDAQHRQHDPQ